MALASARPQPDVTASLGVHQAAPQQLPQPPVAQVVQPMPPQQPQPPVAVAPQVRPVNHVVPEPEVESGDENSGSVGNEKEEDIEFDEPQPEKQQQQQQAEPGRKYLKLQLLAEQHRKTNS